MLLERGAQINSQTDFGRTALHHAVRNYHTSCVRLLIQRGCDVNVQVLYYFIINKLHVINSLYCIKIRMAVVIHRCTMRLMVETFSLSGSSHLAAGLTGSCGTKRASMFFI